MCPLIKGADRPNMCTLHCDHDEQCGPDAMCGLTRGWIRACFPKRCTEFRYDAARVRPIDGTPARHEGAVVHDAGVAFDAAGWGKRCWDLTACPTAEAKACNVFYYPPGVAICGRECRTDARCGAGAYCSYESNRGFSLCLPRSPEPEHRAMTAKPAALDGCKVEGTVVDWSRNELGVGRPCTADGECLAPDGRRAAEVVCGASVTGTQRRPDSCTRPCRSDAECGRNALCVDLDRGLASTVPPGRARYCVPGCWAI